MDASNFRYDTPHGPIYGYLADDGLHELRLPVPGHPIQPNQEPDHALSRKLMDLFSGYFAGEAVDFGEIPLAPSLGTPFQRTVWNALCKIPHGQTLTYGELASRIDNPPAARAVGGALHANPICIIIPCHRILGAGGKLIGYGAGLDWKRRLLRIEGVGGWKE